MNKTKKKSDKNKGSHRGRGTIKEFNIVYIESLEELLATEFYDPIKYDPAGKEFLKQLKESGSAKVLIGGNIAESLVLEVKKVDDNKIQYSANELKIPPHELTDVLGTEMWRDYTRAKGQVF